MPKISFDYDVKHEYFEFLDKEILSLFHDLKQLQPKPILLRDETKDMLTDSSELAKLDIEYLAKYKRQIVLQYLSSKNKSLLPLYYVYDFLLSNFKDENILSFSKNNNGKWIEFICLISNFYSENAILQKFENKIEFLEEQKIVNTINNKYMKPFSLKLRNGGVWFKQKSELSIARKLNSLIARFGGLDFLYNIFCNLNRYYNNVHHRYIFNIGSQQMTGFPISEIPWNYLILLGFKNIYSKPALGEDKREEIFTEITEIARSFISLYELEQFSNVSRLMNRMKFNENEMYKQVLFSFLYRFQQCDKLFFAKICSTLFEFSETVDTEFERTVKFSIAEYTSLIQKIIIYAPNCNIYQINKLKFEQRELDLIDTLSHKEEICKNYFIPTDFDKMENSIVMRPFVKIGQDYYFVDCSYSCWNFYNAIFLLLHKNTNLKKSVSETIGKNIEKILIEECNTRNFKIHYGHYRGSDFECDLVIETKKSVIFIECKKKEFSNHALAGDKNKLLDDYIKAVIEAQSQCAEHATFLKEHGCMNFIGSASTLSLNDREIIRISVSLFDTYALNEHFTTIRGVDFSSHIRYKLEISSDKVTKKEIKREEKKIEKANKKLESIQKNSILLSGNDSMKQRLNELNAWNLSLEHLLFLLQKSEEDSKELDEELQMMKNMTSCSSDFYIEYENARAIHSGI